MLFFMFLFPWNCFFHKGKRLHISLFFFFEQQKCMNFISSHLHVFSLQIQSFVKQSVFFNTEKQPYCIDLF